MFTNEVKNLMFDLSMGGKIYDAETNREISTYEANEAIRRVCFEELGLNEKSTEKQIKRALKSEKAVALFEVLEEVIEQQVSYGLKENEFFNNYVETRNLADGDRTDFWVDDEVLLTVSKVSGDHHDLTIQRLGAGSSFTVPTSVYGIKIGGDIRLFLTSRKNWNDLTDAVAKAFIKKVQEELLAEFLKVANAIKITSALTGTGALSTAKKDDFDEVITNVAMANETQVVIMGTKTALKQLNKLAGVVGGTADVHWVPESQKEQIAATGILGSYEGTTLIEIPNRFKDNKLAQKYVKDDFLLILPLVDDFKPIKFIDGGETILEVSEIGQTMDDMQTYEAQRRMGIATIVTRKIGKWSLS
mgnify:CR=1 FL=1